ncbi:Ran-specific GTPase-activating protein 30 [Diatrype stigma]|uniref:Ran-specific GTPase-activating protein 30 n=1 Tax=Diatrype stigma TaxID=117547 RepID=A0AAN9UJT5_9PEZI
MARHGARLLKLSLLHRRLTRKIELISPILETLEFHYNRGNSALAPVVRTAREIRAEIDELATRFEATAVAAEDSAAGRRPAPSVDAAARRAALLSIVSDMQELILRIDDSIPGINMWVSAIGGIQSQPSSFSPSRLLQASYLVNVGDTQYVLNPGQPVQIGPNFILSLYMLFRGHASHGSEEPYGIEEGQRKPMWQEVIHKARVRLCRVPFHQSHLANGIDKDVSVNGYAYQLQIVEDLDDGRVHTFDDGDAPPTPYDGIAMAGIRELIPVGQIARMLYADVGRILNINNEDGASSNPVLLLKRDIHATPLGPPPELHENIEQHREHSNLIEDITDQDALSPGTLSDSSQQDDIDRQLREESQATDQAPRRSANASRRAKSRPAAPANHWRLPQDLDPEWIALEVFEFNDEDDEDDEDDEPSTDYEDGPTAGPSKRQRPKRVAGPSVDSNLVTQLHRMSLAPSSVPSSRASSRGSIRANHSRDNSSLQLQRSSQPRTSRRDAAAVLTTTENNNHMGHASDAKGEEEFNETLIDRSPFGAIRTSLSLLEMLLRLASLQEFEQATHLAIPDHVLRFYLDEHSGGGTESGSGGGGGGGLHGSRERLVARAEAERKVGFDPYVDSPVRGGGGGGAGSGF